MQSGTNTINTAIFVDVAGVMAIACLDYAAEPLHSSAMCSASSHQPIDLDLAIAHREAGQYKQSVLVTQRWLDQHPDDAEAHALLAQVLSFDNQEKPAWAALQKALSLNPNLPVVLRNHARLLLKQNNIGEALQTALRAYRSDTTNPENQLVLATALSRTKQAEQALALVEGTLHSHPHYAEALAVRALLKLGRNDLAGALADAERSVSIKPHLGQMWGVVGMLHQRLGDQSGAVKALTKAAEYEPNNAAHWLSLGDLKRRAGAIDEAISLLEKATILAPTLTAAWVNLGAALLTSRRIPEAKVAYAKALEISPEDVDVFCNLSVVARLEGNLEDALRLINKALELSPDLPEANCNLGNTLRDLGRLGEAEVSYRRALLNRPHFAEALCNLGSTLRDLGQLEEAEENCRRAIAIKPDFSEALAALGVVLCDLSKLSEGAANIQRALELKPEFAEAQNSLGNAFKDQGKIDDALASYNRALSIRTDYAEAHSNRLMTLHYSDNFSGSDIFTAAKLFSDACESRLSQQAFDNSDIGTRRLRIGYVSGDFAGHPVGYFMINMLAAHDRGAVEVYCYSNRNIEDGVTDLLRQSADHWRKIAGVTDLQLASTIRRDKIDILVDLSGHTAKNRLLLFSPRPAPIQVTWLGYFGTTGLSSMDYLLADRFVVSDGEDNWFTEKVLRLPDSYLCFSPPALDCSILAPPSMRGNPITFGNFNNHSKTSPATVALWARILSAVANSRLLLKTRALNDSTVRQRLAHQFSEHGVDPGRLLLEGNSPRRELLLAYNRVDVALDPMPYGGGTTTAEALWMGVPVVTFRGATWVGRVSESIVTTVGFPEFVAHSLDEYVSTACRLATNSLGLAELRSRLRPQLEASALCDARRFTGHLEQAYLSMWRDWCASRSSTASMGK